MLLPRGTPRTQQALGDIGHGTPHNESDGPLLRHPVADDGVRIVVGDGMVAGEGLRGCVEPIEALLPEC